MLEIVKKGSVDKAIVKVWPDWMELSKKIRTSEITLPATFSCGKQWELTHACNHCGNTISIGSEFGNENYIAGTNLHIASIQDQALLDQIGELFKLRLVNKTDVNKKGIYYYYDSEVYQISSDFTYYKCKHCHAQYIKCNTTINGKERPPEPDSIYLKAILEVTFNEANFMELYKR